jgi:hypothetical protein
MRIDDVKYCTRCKSFKLVTAFAKHQGWCRECFRVHRLVVKSARELSMEEVAADRAALAEAIEWAEAKS